MPSNHLYKEMAKVIKTFEPKAFIFENVRGLLSAKWTKEGTKGEIFEDVKKEFMANDKISDFRTAAYKVAIEKIAMAYDSIGL